MADVGSGAGATCDPRGTGRIPGPAERRGDHSARGGSDTSKDVSGGGAGGGRSGATTCRRRREATSL